MMALRQRKAAIEAYEADPNICKSCLQPIPVRDGEKVAVTRKKVFCSQSCAATLNNHLHPKKTPKPQPCGSCTACGKEIPSNRARYCSGCRDYSNAFRAGVDPLIMRTKGDLFKSRKNWQSARSAIAKHARRILLVSGRNPSCEAPHCDYSHHVDVCHRRGVSDFPDDAVVQEINDLLNLLFLCPNHHHEFDHGVLHM